MASLRVFDLAKGLYTYLKKLFTRWQAAELSVRSSQSATDISSGHRQSPWSAAAVD